MMSPSWHTGDLAAQLASLRLVPESGDDRRHWPLLAAVAVLSRFIPDEVRCVDGAAPDAETLAWLLERCALVGRPGASYLRLDPDVRRRALERLGTRDAMRKALAGNPVRKRDGLQIAFEQELDGAAPPLGEASTEQLACRLEVTRWLNGILDGTSDPEAVKAALDFAYLLEPFRVLGGEGFRGRTKDLRRLREYVGLVGGRRQHTVIAESVLWGAGLYHKPPLVVHGIGGIGKSALLARFVLEHAGDLECPGLSFAYIDFDRPNILADEPPTLVLELARQLSIQRPDHRAELEDFRARWAQQLRNHRTRQLGPLSSGRASIVVGDQYAFAACVAEFSAITKPLFAGDQPLVLILDTFEEAQYRSPHLVEAIWELLEEVQRAVPVLRTIVAGRAKIEDLPAEHHKLQPLETRAAIKLLEDAQVPPDEARDIVRRFGGNPLTLRLAAGVAADPDMGMSAIEDVPGRTLLRRVSEESIQAQLYRRILGHIHERPVACLAHPGMVLRRVTPDVIARVLAEPCGLGAIDATRAQELFDGLRREITLVAVEAPDVLVHRSDVRKVMLPLLRADDPKGVMAVHNAAVRYYERLDGPVDREEELYHRLARADSREQLDVRWDEEIGQRLVSALPELPARSQRYLAGRTGAPLDERVWRSADLEERERGVEQEARALLAVGKAEEALKVIRGLQERTATGPLYVVEAIAARDLGCYDEAQAAVEHGLAVAADLGPTRNELELLQLSGTLHEELDERERAAARFESAFRAARALHDAPQLLQVAIRWLDTTADANLARVELFIADEVRRLPDDKLADAIPVALQLADRLRGDDPVIREAVKRLRLPVPA
jgi:hypothetical protein